MQEHPRYLLSSSTPIPVLAPIPSLGSTGTGVGKASRGTQRMPGVMENGWNRRERRIEVWHRMGWRDVFEAFLMTPRV